MGKRVPIIAVLACAGSLALVHAQTTAWTPPYHLKLTPARAHALIDAADRKLPYVPGEVLVKFRDGMSAVGQQRALLSVRSQPRVSDLKWSRDVAVLKDTQELDATILAAQLREQPEVEYAEPNYLYRVHAEPNDPGYTRAQWNFSALDMPRAWDINPGASADITVAILDTGITTVNQAFTFPTWDGTTIQNISVPFATNPDLNANRLVSAQDFVFWDGPVLDMDGHATHVSGTIGEETNNGIAEAGLAYNVKIMPLKVCFGYWEVQFVLSSEGEKGYAPLDVGACPDDAIATALQYAADNGAKVINLSLGGPTPSLTMQNAVRYAVSKGAVITMSGGNEFEQGNPLDYPAAYAKDIDGALAVGAVNRSMDRAFYSNTGDDIEVVAPGGDPRDSNSAGDGMIWQTTLAPSDADPESVVFPRFDRYAEVGFAGTSMAAPHVAGTAALLISQGITSPAAVEALLEKTARDLGAKGRDPEFGFGLIQPRTALFGFGVAR